MKTREEKLKIKAAMLYLLNKYPEGIHRISFYKLLFFAQQYELVNYGRVLLADRFMAVERGPVPSFVQGMIHAKENHTSTDDVLDIVNSFDILESGSIVAKESACVDNLAPIDIRSIDYAYDLYGQLSVDDLVSLSHEQACWKEAWRRAQKDPEKNLMSRLEIAKSGNASPEMLLYIKSTEICNRYLA